MLVAQHATETYRLAAAIVGVDDAADVSQETLVVAWQQLPKLRDPEAFQAWLRRICVNRSRNWLRTRARRPRAALQAESRTAPTSTDQADFRTAAEATPTPEDTQFTTWAMEFTPSGRMPIEVPDPEAPPDPALDCRRLPLA